MNEDAKKTALRMIPYGLYVLTAEGKNGAVAAATVNWVTQAAFAPPLVVLGVKIDSGAHAIIKETGEFALNILGKGQQAMAYAKIYPEQGKGGRGIKALGDRKVSGERVSLARAVLREAPDLANRVLSYARTLPGCRPRRR